jgi:hypothetical protein
MAGGPGRQLSLSDFTGKRAKVNIVLREYLGCHIVWE